MPALLQQLTPWQAHRRRWENCRRCALCDQRSRIVLARGDVPCDVLFVGEAPGDSEDASGLPFWGPAGQLLDGVVAEASAAWQIDGTSGTGYNQFGFAFTNLCCCYPAVAKQGENHQPLPQEIRECAPRLREFVDICRPRLIVCVGALASQYIGWSVDAASERWEIVAITHPAAVLRALPIQRGGMRDKMVSVLRKALEQLAEKGLAGKGA
jgi:uracil-DNA glycosylase